ncbi:PREDICTED: long-chain-fatty-acid--CoA ligase ACSBG2 [Elephantulus edwardii]|uniref:long-chain-fatty-acid--CoA ligase ACSBG2 n=1 Tax=Elephantulus edwardii TaxID=28737 RepID=UPI0003F0C201|nr:PREDICTED: long-chain-fatty-acid--CoA ligase ACSBG2 [Elephantulus edwardii]
MYKAQDTLKLWTTHRYGEVLLRLTKHGPGHEPPMTIPEFFHESVSRFGIYPAVSSMKNNQWESMNYNQYYEACRKAARALLKLGLERFDAVGILGFNSVEWFIAALGTILAGGLCVGIYATSSPEACQYFINDSKMKILLVENDKQLQKIFMISGDKMKTLKAIVQYKLPLKESHRSNVYSWDEFMELSSDVSDIQLDQVIESQKANQCAMLIYTSGTTGIPKGVMLSHDNGTLVSTLHYVKPTCFLGVPQIWEKMQEKIKETGTKSSALKKKVFSWARNVGTQFNSKRMLGNPNMPMSYYVAKTLVFSQVRHSLGLDRCHFFLNGAAPLTQDTAEFFLSLDIPICQIYGMSESSGPHAVSTPKKYRPLSCGKVLSGCRNLLYQQDHEGVGEICFWGRHIFMGYLEKEDATKEAIDKDGWLHSGDLGRMDKQGFLFITGRIKELLITAGGENVAPVPIENLIKDRIPIVSHALLVGDQAKYLSVLLTLKCEIDPVTHEPQNKLTLEAIHYCKQLGSEATTVSEILSQRDPLIYSAIQEGIDKVNEMAVSNAQMVQKWTILDKDFSIVGGELGPTSKMKRHFITEKYRKEILDLYS